jgi:hypothetical protein
MKVRNRVKIEIIQLQMTFKIPPTLRTIAESPHKEAPH